MKSKDETKTRTIAAIEIEWAIEDEIIKIYCVNSKCFGLALYKPT